MANTPWPIILLIHTEHLRLLHAGPTLFTTYPTRHTIIIVGGRRLIRPTRNCITCRKFSTKPNPKCWDRQLPPERVTPSPVFDKVRIYTMQVSF